MAYNFGLGGSDQWGQTGGFGLGSRTRNWWDTQIPEADNETESERLMRQILEGMQKGPGQPDDATRKKFRKASIADSLVALGLGWAHGDIAAGFAAGNQALKNGFEDRIAAWRDAEKERQQRDLEVLKTKLGIASAQEQRVAKEAADRAAAEEAKRKEDAKIAGLSVLTGDQTKAQAWSDAGGNASNLPAELRVGYQDVLKRQQEEQAKKDAQQKFENDIQTQRLQLDREREKRMASGGGDDGEGTLSSQRASNVLAAFGSIPGIDKLNTAGVIDANKAGEQEVYKLERRAAEGYSTIPLSELPQGSFTVQDNMTDNPTVMVTTPRGQVAVQAELRDGKIQVPINDIVKQGAMYGGVQDHVETYRSAKPMDSPDATNGAVTQGAMLEGFVRSKQRPIVANSGAAPEPTGTDTVRKPNPSEMQTAVSEIKSAMPGANSTRLRQAAAVYAAAHGISEVDLIKFMFGG